MMVCVIFSSAYDSVACSTTEIVIATTKRHVEGSQRRRQTANGTEGAESFFFVLLGLRKINENALALRSTNSTPCHYQKAIFPKKSRPRLSVFVLAMNISTRTFSPARAFTLMKVRESVAKNQKLCERMHNINLSFVLCGGVNETLLVTAFSPVSMNEKWGSLLRAPSCVCVRVSFSWAK